MSTKFVAPPVDNDLRALALREKCHHVIAVLDCECIDDLMDEVRDEAVRECDGLVCDLEPNDESMARAIDSFLDRLLA